jgi:hypothetical protein
VLSLKASPPSLAAGPSNESTITCYASFSDGEPVPDETEVSFLTTEGTITSSAETGSGIALADLSPGGVASDEVRVTATCGNTSTFTDLVFGADDPAVVYAYALPETIPGDGTTATQIVAEVTDLYGNPVKDGTLVGFSVVEGSGTVTPTALTLGGTATARFTASGGSGVATVRASCETYDHDAGVVILPDSPGAIVVNPDTAWIAISETYETSQTTVYAQVFDAYSNPVADSTEVSFEIIQGPNGGEYLEAPASGHGPVIKQTSGGVASVSVNSGTQPGTVLMTVSSGDAPSTACAIGIAAGDPDSIMISLGEVNVNGDGTYSLAVSAIVRDQYQNPVENGTAVYFTLEEPNRGTINPETYTGGDYPCVELTGDPIKGISRACLSYPTESIFESLTINASTTGGQVESELSTVLPIVNASLSIEAFPASIYGPGGGEVTVVVTVWDHYKMIPVDKALVGFSVTGDGSVSPYSAVTDESGSCSTTLTIPVGTEEGTSTVSAKLWMTDVQADIQITITE